MKTFKKVLFPIVWLLIWESAALLVHNDILLVGPLDTVKALVRLLPQASFWQSVAGSVARVAGGVACGALLGSLAGFLAYRYPVAGDFLYGTELPELPGRFALHSAELSLRHPVTGEPLRIVSPLPEALKKLLTRCPV